MMRYDLSRYFWALKVEVQVEGQVHLVKEGCALYSSLKNS
jgi:hypothetical protein